MSEMYHIKLPKSETASEKWWLGDYIPFGKAYFQGAMLFQGGQYIYIYT